MKECPICHTQYDDTLNFCVKDGYQLMDKPTDSQQPSHFHASEPQQPVGSPKPKNGGCLKKIIIGAVVVVVGLVVLYRYLMNAATYLRVEPEQLIAAKCGGEATVEIDYDGYVWVINHKPEWVTVEENDDDFQLTFGPNTSGSPRQGTITIQSGSLLAQVALAQNAYASYIKPSVTTLKFGKNGGNKTVNVDSDGTKWTVSYPNYLNVETAQNSFTVRVPSNDGDFRQGTITISEDNVQATVMFQQAGRCPNCHGLGSTTCSLCSGMGGSGFGMYYVQCGWCGGRGSLNCGVCGGTGVKE